MGVDGVCVSILLKGSVQNYARTVVAVLWDFEVLHLCLHAVPAGLENGVDHGLERGPAIEWGHEASSHEHPGITRSKAVVHETIL